MGSRLLAENQKLLAVGGAALALGLAAYQLGSSKSPSFGEALFHLALETGGTSCKVGIINDAKSLKICKSKIIKTTTPKETVEKICQYINEQPETFSSIGIAAFGPLCLDRSSPNYGSVTTTPKKEWQHTPLLNMVLDGINKTKKTQDFRVAFDTDCNILAKFELDNGGHEGVSDNIAYITVGTGVGVGLWINGQAIHGLIHPEGGHVAVPKLPQEESKYGFKGVCIFHQDKCVEGLCTNVAIAERLKLESVDAVKDLPDDHEVWDMIAFYLGTMCANLTMTISVAKIVMGGGVMLRGEVLISKIRKHFLQTINGYLQHPKFNSKAVNDYIVLSKFKDDLGIVSSAATGATGEIYGHRTRLGV